MSRRVALEQKRYAAGIADTQGWQFEILLTPALPLLRRPRQGRRSTGRAGVSKRVEGNRHV